MPFGTGFSGPMKLRDDEVFLGDNPGLEVLKFDALPAAEFGQAIFDLLADDAGDLDAGLPVVKQKKRLSFTVWQKQLLILSTLYCANCPLQKIAVS